MYYDYKITIVTPAGRKKYMRILKNYIFQNDLVDEWQIWQNTQKEEDIKYLHEICQENDRVKIYNVHGSVGSSFDIHKFFVNTIDKNTIYIRFDDDIVWMEKDSIQNLLLFRIQNPQYFLVYGNIINNSICDHIHQRLGATTNIENIGYTCMDYIGWANGKVAELKHKNLFNLIKKNKTHEYKFNKWILNQFERCSINVICWFGADFFNFHGIVGRDEEEWLSSTKPKNLNKHNVICGSSLFSHFSFYIQRDYLDRTNLLEIYDYLSKHDNLQLLSLNKKHKLFM